MHKWRHTLAAGLLALVYGLSGSDAGQSAPLQRIAQIERARAQAVVDYLGAPPSRLIRNTSPPMVAVVVTDTWKDYLDQPSTYAQMTEAGFNEVLLTADGTPDSAQRVLHAMDLAGRYGMKVMVSDTRTPQVIKDDSAAILDNMVATYSHHPAFANFLLRDEPSAQMLNEIAKVAAEFKKRDPLHPPHINLFPNFATLEQLGTPTYDAYLDAVTQLGLPFITVDFYPFQITGDRPSYYENLQSIWHFTERSGIQTSLVTQLSPHWNQRPIGQDEIEFQATQPLAFGLKSTMPFSYAFTGMEPEFKESCINADGSPTNLYWMTKDVNNKYDAIRKTLNSSGHETTLMNGAQPVGVSLATATPSLKFVEPDSTVTAGLFKQDTTHYAFLANRDYHQNTTTTPCIASAIAPEQYDIKTGQWNSVGKQNPLCGYEVKTTLSPGEGNLIRWK